LAGAYFLSFPQSRLLVSAFGFIYAWNFLALDWFGLVWFLFVSFHFVSFRFVSFRFVAYFVSALGALCCMQFVPLTTISLCMYSMANKILTSCGCWLPFLQGIGDMLYLEELNISDNKISRLPYGIGMCKSLKKLIIGMDHTIKIPCDSILRTCADDAQVMSPLEQGHASFTSAFPAHSF